MAGVDANALVADLEGRVPPAVYACRLREFMLESAELIRTALPDVAANALDVAHRYWAGGATDGELMAARIGCWRYIDGLGTSSDLQTPAVCGTRAVLVLLYPEAAEDDPLESAGFFIDMANKLESHNEEHCVILRRLFREFLPA